MSDDGYEVSADNYARTGQAGEWGQGGAMGRYLEFNGPEAEPLGAWWRLRLRVRGIRHWLLHPRLRRLPWVETVPVPEGGLAAALTEIIGRPGWAEDGIHLHIVDDDTGWAVPVFPESLRIPRGSIITEARFGLDDGRLHLRIQHSGAEAMSANLTEEQKDTPT